MSTIDSHSTNHDAQHQNSHSVEASTAIAVNSNSTAGIASGSSILTSDTQVALDQAINGNSGSLEHDHAPDVQPLPTGEGAIAQTGTTGTDHLVGSQQDDFLKADNLPTTFEAQGIGGTEFPFRTDSPGTTEVTAEIRDGQLQIEGSYNNFDGLPLFSAGETAIDPKAEILNGSDPQALIDGFLEVPTDREGNPISGFHMHTSPAGDDRGDFADATVERYLTVNPTDAKSGTLSGDFNLTPVEEAAGKANLFYINAHTNVDGDGDGKAGFPTGENRINLNKDAVST